MRPVRAKAFIINASALTGRFALDVLHPGRCPGLGAIWAFSPRSMHYYKALRNSY